MIAVDWGTTSFRAYRLDAEGRVVDHRSATSGLLSVDGDFAGVLARHIEAWDDRLVLMAGMVGSRSGWREVPYVDCPAGLHEVAAGMCELGDAMHRGRRIFIAPGVCHRAPGAAPDVMRGEETQVLGIASAFVGEGPHTVCLPGTHSKWVQVVQGRIVSLRTAMTGELYALMRHHSLLASLMQPSAASDVDVDDADAFARGMAACAGEGGLTHHLFGVRTLGLFAELEPAQAPSYLSGLLIGHELRAMLPLSTPQATTVHVVGSAALRLRYERALRVAGVVPQGHDDQAVARGLYGLARLRGLVG